MFPPSELGRKENRLTASHIIQRERSSTPHFSQPHSRASNNPDSNPKSNSTMAATQSLSSPTLSFQNPSTILHRRGLTSVVAATATFSPIHRIRPPSSLVVPRKTTGLSIKCQQSEYGSSFEDSPTSFGGTSSRSYKDPSSSSPRLNNNTNNSNNTTTNNNTVSYPASGKVFVGYTIYKGKAVLDIVPRAPEFATLESGNSKLSKDGYIFLQFAPAYSLQQYDWSRKQVFSLSVAELGTLISLGPGESCEFFHDPYRGRSDEGKVRKVLKVEPLPDGSGRFFNLSVQNKLLNKDESIYIPVSKGEFTVLVTTFQFVLPYLLGWHIFANSIAPDVFNRTNSTNSTNASSRASVDYEWSR